MGTTTAHTGDEAARPVVYPNHPAYSCRHNGRDGPPDWVNVTGVHLEGVVSREKG